MSDRRRRSGRVDAPHRPKSRTAPGGESTAPAPEILEPSVEDLARELAEDLEALAHLEGRGIDVPELRTLAAVNAEDLDLDAAVASGWISAETAARLRELIEDMAPRVHRGRQRRTDIAPEGLLRQLYDLAAADVIDMEHAAAGIEKAGEVEALAGRELEPYRNPGRRASLARYGNLRSDDARLPDLEIVSVPAAPGEQLQLFDLGPPTVEGCTSWLLYLFDASAIGDKMHEGGAAPWALRLWVALSLHLPTELRDGRFHPLMFREDQVIEWFHPNGWNNRRRDREKLPKALEDLNRLAWIPVPGGGPKDRVQMMGYTGRRGDWLEFHVRCPPSAARGDRISWPRLQLYGQKSATLYRAYLSAVAFMGRSARNGLPITAELWVEPRNPPGPGYAIDNPHARYVRPLTSADLARMIGLDGDNRDHRHKALQAFLRLTADGVVDLREAGPGQWRLFGPAV